MLGQYLNDTTTFGAGGYVPLEITTAVIENGIQLVGDEFVGREDAERFGVPIKLNERKKLSSMCK